ncbi:COMM domain-containing protein 9 isoform X1 [Paroedura picta]|uniref:COMM domain-containing protein 9 isoform X1 n=1 Tax=Paroedura picta TaxID=143630 RepID=UPI004055D0AA
MAAAPSEEQFAALQILLKASKKDEVRHLCQECFLSSAGGSEKLIEDTCSTLSVASDEAKQLICSLHNLSRHVVHRGLTSPEEILSLFPEGFHQNLKNLLTKIILENLSAWRNEVQASQISLPRLIDMDWRVDIKTSSDSVSRMAVPTCLLQLKPQEEVEYAAQGGGELRCTGSLQAAAGHIQGVGVDDPFQLCDSLCHLFY